MDWINHPHPFRYYDGTKVTQLALGREPAQLAYDQIYELNVMQSDVKPNDRPFTRYSYPPFSYPFSEGVRSRSIGGCPECTEGHRQLHWH